MKKKTFILTLMMLLCTFVFGQDQWHWQKPASGEYQSSMTLMAIIQIDNENQSRADLEMAAFHEGVVRGVTKTQVLNYNGVPTSVVVLTIRGNYNNEDIKFKLYVPPTDGDNEGKELVTDLVVPFRAESFIGNITPEFVNFYEVHWSSDIVYDQTMTVGCEINIDGVPYEGTDVEVAAFCNGEVRGVGKPMYWEETDTYYTELIVGGKSKGEIISFKLYHHEYGELDTDYIVPFENGATITDENNQAVQMNFIYNSYVAKIGENKYTSLEAAVEAVGIGETITVLKDITMTETLVIAAEKNFTLDLNGNDIAADLNICGNLIVIGEGDFNANVVLAKETATLTAVAGLNVTTTIDAYSVVYENGMYKLKKIVYVAQVGSTKYETLEEAYNAATAENGIVLLSNITLQSTWKIEKDINISLNNNTVTGTIELANTGATVTGQSSEMTVTSGVERYMVVCENGVYKLEKEPSGEIAYRAYITDSETREAVQVDLTNIIAKQSVVVKLYDANGNALTTTTLKAGAAEAANLTCNIVLWGNPSSSWETTIHTALTVANVPAKIELWIDGELKDILENALGAGTNVDETAKYIALDCVYKEARIGNTYYATINKAIAAAQSGQTIVLLADVTLANAIDITGKTLDLNGNTVKADIIGTVKTNGGLWITSTGHKMLGKGADIYSTENSTVINSANEVNIVSGAITLAATEWWTLQGQNLTINSGATFTIPATSKFNVMNGTTVTVNGTAINNGTLAIYGTAIVNGTFTATGTVELADVNATLKAQAGLNVITNIADHKVVYADGMYKVVAKVYVAQVGSTKYEILSEAVNAVQSGQTVTVLKDITLAETLTIAAEKSFTLDLNGKAINVAYQENSTDKHIYAFDNKGTLTLANGTINARGIYNYGTLTVNANATINSIDANGGYGVGNYGTLNVYGTIATTTENNDAPTTGNYDATPIVNEVGATINVYEGSKITNVSNFTYALINNGTALIEGGTITSAHTAVGNSGTMTIEGGSFVCNGAEGVTSHAFIAEAGTTTIKGGTFDGKDNYNGFNVCASEGATVKIEGGNFLSCHSGSLYGNGTIEVSGGKFFDAVPENRCAAGYIPTQFADGTYGVKAGSYIAQIGTTKYETFEEAYAAAQAGDVIELFRTVVLTSNYNYEKQVTVKSAFGETAFRVKAEVSFNNMTINSDDYCVIVGASDGAGKLTINGGTYNGETTAVSVTKGEVNINGGTFKVEPYQGSYEYTINCIDANYNNKTAKVAIQGGKFYNFNPMNNAAEGANTNFVVANHITVKDTDNYWTVVALPTTDKIVSSEDHTVTSNGYGPATVTVTGEVPCVANGQGIVSNWIGFRITKPQGIDANVARVFTPGSNGTYNEKTLASILDEGQDYASMWVSIQYKRVFDYKIDWNNDGIMDLVINIDATTATIKHNYVEVERVEPSYGQDGYILYRCGCGHEYKETLPAELVAQIGETKYSTLEAAVEAVQSGETITVLKDITLAETLTIAAEKSFTLDLNEKAINAAYQENSTDKHIYAFDNKGALTLANGTINARGIYNYGTLTVNANATINSIDANGGYGVDNYGTLNVYGTIATTNEDGDTPEDGNYDATPINNRTNATANVFEGSAIANVSNFTYALDNKGTAIIKGGSFSGGHTTVGNSGTMTIEGGSFVCNGSEGVSSHAFIAEAGTTTIKGGTFDGKDNYNGFNVCASEGATVKIEGGNFLSCHSGSLYGNGTIEVSGGKFFDAVPENRCAAGYIPTQFTDGTYGVKPGSYIAQIGTTKYETFDEAYTAAKTGDVVVLFRTVVITNSKPWINYSKKNITVKAEFGETAFRVQDGAYVWFGGMTIESNDYCIIVGASDSSSGATVELYGGTYYGATSAVSVTKGDVKIMDGTFKVEPYQGSYEYTINCIDANYNNKTAKVAIQGGKFYNFNPMNNAAEGANTNFVVANHITVKDTDNYWTVVALPTTDKIVSSEDHTVTSNGYGPATVTVTGEVPCVANGQGIVSNWIGFRITKPEGVDANVARVFTPGSNGTYNEKTLASILDEGKDYASMWASIQYKREFDYKIDWNNDGIMDLVINIDATTATIKHNYVEVERVKPSYGQDGYILYRCGCGHEYKEILPAENVAQIGETKYTTLEAAAAAAKADETIVVLADVETTSVTLPENVTLDLNGKTVKADIIGKILINNGLWVTAQNYKMIGKNADYYETADAAIVMGAKYSIEMLSGTVTLVPNVWYTLDGQNITIKQDATFNIGDGKTFVINGSNVVNEGTVNNAGTIQILAGTVKGNVTGNLQFKGGSYITAEDFNMVGKVGDSDYYYNTNNATINIAANGDITIASGDMTLGKSWRTLPGQTVTVAEGATFTVPSGMTYQIYGTAIVNGTLTVNGTVELAVLEATLKAQSGLNVITNIANHAVAYENGTYKVVQSIYEQRQILGAGWNWFSSYININGETGFEKLQTALGTSGLHIKNQHQFVDYNQGWGWNGTLESTSVEEMYMIQTSEQVELVLTGELANPATEITLNNGWTYIGYPVATAMNIETAFAGIEPQDGDIIKTHGGVAQYYAETKTWYSQSLTSMTPGFGYMYKNNGGEQTLVYSAANTRAEVRANVTSENNRWVPNASAFANNMNIIAVLESNDMMGEFEVAAFVNGEVRGSARPTYVEPIDAYVLFMTIYGEEGDELTFKYYDIYSDEEHSISNTVNYSDNAVIGSIKAPYMFFANTLGMDENAANTLSLYPNPTTTNAAISFETIYDIVEVFNSLGVKVAEYRNVDRIEGMEAAGVYVIRVTNDNAVQNCRLIVK